MTDPSPGGERRFARWTVAVLVVSSPLLVALFSTLWRTPFPVSEAVALFEDVAKMPAAAFLRP